jgi:DNA polymerase III gamma/tau subunit
VNDFISAIAEKDLESGIATVRNASKENLDMKLFAKLIIQKFRMAIILKYAPKLEAEMSANLSPEDITFLKELSKKDKEGMMRSPSLSILLEAYQNIDKSFVSELPLELALIKILTKE